MDNTQNIISFCTGYGGIELGLRRAGVDVRTVCNVEIEAFVQANLVAKIEEGYMDDAPIYSDLKTFPARIFRGKIHGVIGGYPCQPFSSAGKRKGEKDPRHLWPYIREHVRAIRPVWCFFENVRGHTTKGLWRVLSDLEEDGYRTEWGLFSAEETGAPHQRIRCFILAKLPHTKIEGLEGYPGLRTEQNRGCESTKDDLSEPQLAHTASREPRQSQARNGGQDIGGGSEEELADSKSRRDRRKSREFRGKKKKPEGENAGDEFIFNSEETRWPARPGEEQYEWEEPRVVADRSVKRCGGRKNKDGENGEGLSEQEREERSILRGETKGCCGDGETTLNEAQSELGGAVDGSACGVDATANRVDRLRLLGNGVVPQTAEIAWKNLWEKLSEQS